MRKRPKPGELRHRVKVIRPAPQTRQKGDKPESPQTIHPSWPCQVVTLSGRELELAQQMRATATLEVNGYGDPGNPFSEIDVLDYEGRQLNVMGIIDHDQNGFFLTLLCGEEKGIKA